MHCDFVQVTAKDGVNLEGLVFSPSTPSRTSTELGRMSRSGQTAVAVWIHGLGSNFHRNYKRTTTLARVFNEAGIAFVSFDTRGHDWIAHAVKTDRRKAKGYRGITIGSSYEKFTDSAYDLDAIVDYLLSQFKNVILLGHSTGANKAVYYLSRKGTQKKVRAVALVSPVSDPPMERKMLGSRYEETVKMAKKMVSEKRSWDVLPQSLSRSIYPAQRFLSLACKESIEQMFPNKEFRGPLRLFSRIKVPSLILFGELDDYLKIDKIKVREVFDVFSHYSKSKSFKTISIPEADHGFSDKEEELANTLVSWIKELEKVWEGHSA